MSIVTRLHQWFSLLLCEGGNVCLDDSTRTTNYQSPMLLRLPMETHILYDNKIIKWDFILFLFNKNCDAVENNNLNQLHFFKFNGEMNESMKPVFLQICR